jgi:hypothetical protein
MGPVTLSALTTPKKAALQLELSHRREQQVRVVFPVVRSIGEELYVLGRSAILPRVSPIPWGFGRSM